MNDKILTQSTDIRVPKSQKLVRLVLTGLLFAAAIVLSMVEDALQLPVPAPGVKFGLSNIVVMYALFFLGKKEAYLVAVLKSMFVFITRGLIASVLSLSGGILSITVMILLMVVFKDKISYLIISIAGSVFHNLGQLIAVSLIYTNLLLIVYLPILLVSGVIAGIATSTLLRVFIPALKKLGFRI
jgi:heptaprenyl diphosphate synthase